MDSAVTEQQTEIIDTSIYTETKTAESTPGYKKTRAGFLSTVSIAFDLEVENEEKSDIPLTLPDAHWFPGMELGLGFDVLAGEVKPSPFEKIVIGESKSSPISRCSTRSRSQTPICVCKVRFHLAHRKVPKKRLILSSRRRKSKKSSASPPVCHSDSDPSVRAFRQKYLTTSNSLIAPSPPFARKP